MAKRAFFELDASLFPFTVELYDLANGELLWSADVPGPGAVVVPGFARPCLVRTTWADGSTSFTTEETQWR